MQYKAILSSFIIINAMWSFSAHAIEPVALQHMSFNDLRHTFQLIFPNQSLKLPLTKDSLRFVSQHIDHHNIRHIRMQQEYAGYPVVSGEIIIHTSLPMTALLQTTKKISMNGLIYKDLYQTLGNPPPDFKDNAKNALLWFKQQHPDGRISDAKVMPIVYVDEQHDVFWAYKVSLLLEPEAAIPQRPTAILNAKNNDILMQWNDLKTIRTAVKGVGFGGNQQVGEYMYGKDLPFLSLNRDDFSGTCYLENVDVKVVDMASLYRKANTPMNFDCPMESTFGDNIYWTGYDGDGYDRKNGGYSPTNDALYVGTAIKAMYRQWYELDVLTLDGSKPMQLIMRTHFGKNYENAFWDGKQMTFGDGGQWMYPLVSLSIAGHEISHGFTEQNSHLEYFAQSGGINEAFSDMAAQAIEYFIYGKNSWTIGADILKKGCGFTALRFMEKPSRDGQSIDNAEQYRKNMDVHYSSGVYNRLFYLLAHQKGWNTHRAFDVMVKANMDYWTSHATFETAACGILDAARDLNLPAEDVEHSLDEVMIDYQDCELLGSRG
jgi:pseudolysin